VARDAVERFRAGRLPKDGVFRRLGSLPMFEDE
jgi:hypothetical protein